MVERTALLTIIQRGLVDVGGSGVWGVEGSK